MVKALTLSNGTQVDPSTLDSNPPDIKVAKLAQTIKGLEGGNYNDRSGDGGSSAGAYQWNNDNKPLKPGELPSHWKNAAAQYLKDSNAPMTPENQNFVAYQQIKAYKDQGRTPEEIDALWNGAKKDSSTGTYTHVSPERQKKFREAVLGASQSSGYNPTPYSNPDSTGHTTSPGQFDLTGTVDQTKPKEGLGSQILHGAGDFLKGLVSPTATMLARPIQAGAELLGASSEDVDKVTKNVTGGLVAPVPQNTSDVKKDVGRGVETAALGLAPVAGGALYGAGNSVEQGNNVLSGKTALGAGLGGLLGGATELASPFIAKGVSAITPKFVKEAGAKVGQTLAPVADAVGNFAKNTKILPDSVSGAINKGANFLNEAPGMIGNTIANQYGFGEGKTKEDALNLVSKALGNTGKKSAGVFAGNDAKRLQGLETLFDEAPNLKVTGEGGAQIPYDPVTATLPQHVEALDNAKSSLYSDLEKNLISATKEGVQVDTEPVITKLQTIANDVGRTAEARTRAASLLESIRQLRTPSQVNSFLQDLNAGLSGVANGTSQNIARKVDMEVTQALNDSLDKSIIDISNNSEPIRIIKNKYSQLKSVEGGLVAKAQQLARRVGGGLNDYINPFNIADAFDLLTHNPMGAVKGAVRAGLLAQKAITKDPEQILQSVFKAIANYKGVPIQKVVQSIIPQLIKTGATAGLIKTGSSLLGK